MEIVNNKHIVLFDGVCNLCSSTVQFILKKDRKKLFHFASLQSETGQQLLDSLGIHDHYLRSLIYISPNKVCTKSDAALTIARQLGGAWRAVYWLHIVPKPIRDKLYDIIARNRYKWFGKKKCWVPTTELKDRFL